jgi:hypothetical protein
MSVPTIYEAFDNFMKTDTWHKSHPNDEMRFYQALDLVVWSPHFDPDRMAKHMRASRNVSPDDSDSGFAVAVNKLRDKAWAVKDFINYTQLHKY